jgi:hypothetical protein
MAIIFSFSLILACAIISDKISDKFTREITTIEHHCSITYISRGEPKGEGKVQRKHMFVRCNQQRPY